MRGHENSQREQFLRFALLLALAVLGASFALSAVVDLFDGASVTLRFGVAAAVCALAARAVRGRGPDRRATLPIDASVPAVMTMATLAWAVVAAGGAGAHLISNSTSDLNTAVFEGMAAATTTSMTALDPDALPMGLHMFRALMQWFGGLGAVVLAVVAIPALLGGRELAGRAHAEGASGALVTGRRKGFRTLVTVYSAITVAVVVAFRLAGMGLFDAVAHGLAAVSTGGLSTRSGSLAAFDSAAIEWVAVVAMSVAGLNIGVIWWALNRNWSALKGSTELRLFALVLLGSTATFALWFEVDDATLTSLRRGALVASSAMSTTGFTSAEWSHFQNGPIALLLVLMSIGAMGGSAGGGIRYLRLLEAAGYARRELRLQLHPSAVGVVRVNGHAVDERTLQRLVAYVVAYFLVVATGAILVAVGDSSVGPASAVGLAISALSTTGAQAVDAVPLADLGAVSKWALATLMLLGRISIYSGIVAAITVATRVRELAR